MKTTLNKLFEHQTLSEQDAYNILTRIGKGDFNHSQIAAFLTVYLIWLGLFPITGVQIGIDANLHPINCIILGTITGSFGGVLRDVFVNEIPVIFKK